MIIFVKVKTGAKLESVKQVDDVHFVVAVSARPEKGKANEAVCKAIAEYFKIPFWRVGIRSGLIFKEKIIEITQ